MRRGTCVALILAASALALPIGVASEPDALAYRYANGFDATGTFAGTCQAVGLRFPQAQAGHLVIHHEGGLVTVVESRLNYTQPGPSGLLPPQWEDVSMVRRPHALAPGDLAIAWTADQHVHASDLGDDGRDPLQAATFGTSWRAGDLARFHAAGPSYFTESPRGRPGLLAAPGVAGWSRPVTVEGQPWLLTGDLGLVAIEARLQQGDWAYQLPRQYEVVEREASMPPYASRRTLVETHAILDLENVRLQLEQPDVEVLCAGLEWSGSGRVTFHQTHGTARVGDELVEFVAKELSVAGVFSASERIEELTVGARAEGWATGQASGDFSALGLDFASVIVKPASAPGLVQVGFWALLGALLLAFLSQFSRLVGLFYTRLDESNALKHPLRKQLLDLVRARPGLIHNDAVAATRQPRGVVRHHLRVLETVGLIRSLRTGKEIHLYLRGANLDQEKRSLVLERDAAARFLVDRVQAGPVARWRAGRDLMDRFGVSRMGAWKMIRRAVQSGLVEAQPGPQGETLRAVGAA